MLNAGNLAPPMVVTLLMREQINIWSIFTALRKKKWTLLRATNFVSIVAMGSRPAGVYRI